LLTTIIDDTSIRAFFELNERVILPYLKERPRPGQEELEIEEGLELQLELTDGSIYDHKGAFDFIDNRIDEKTRTIRVRAVFPNPGGKLAAGMFARIGIPFRVENAVLVPTLAILRDLAGDFVWVVDDNNIVRRRSVEAGPTIGKERIIEDGLAGTDRVIIAGIQRAREGGEVKPETPAPSPEGKGETEAPGEQPDMPDQPKGPEAEAGE
jgi:RND family efflux transporter MFP subunit